MPNISLTQLYQNQKTRICSLEMSAKKEVNFEILDKLKISFCAVIWIGDYEKPPDEIEPLILCKELISKGYTVVLHFPARNHTKKTAHVNLEYAKQIGIKNLMCVRGASPECNIESKKYDFPHTPDLLKFIKSKFGDHFDLCVPGYPFKHPESKTLEEDMKYLKEKSDSGAKFVISSACFSFDAYKDFRQNLVKFKIPLRIIPGIYVLRSVMDFCLLKKMCKIPKEDETAIFVRDHKDEPEEVAAFGFRICTELVRQLLADKDFCPPHLFSMNEFASIKEFIDNIKKKE